MKVPHMYRRQRIGTNVRRAAVALLGILAVQGLGCSGGASGGDAQRAQGLMRMVGIEYGRYQSAHRGEAPKDEAAFRSFLETQISQTPDYGVASADELLTSPRDAQPLQVFYGETVASPEQPDLLWAACEQTGVDGKRLVVNTRGSVMELPTEEINRILSK